jgi:cyanophycinase-like exopeptidase
MKNLFSALFTILFSTYLTAQHRGANYTSYFTGNVNDTTSIPLGGVCLMGGATEDDNAMKWFLQRANGGDILVLRASGADGYNDYFYSELGVSINSVETIVFQTASASDETYIHDKIAKAEAIWFAGGDQWNYVSYWRGTKIDSLINDGIKNRKIVIGGTSAGMAILGGYYFSAQNGTVTSATALANPYANNVTVDSASFIKVPYMKHIITDTHYDDPDRRGRHVTFMARIISDYAGAPLGIACDEYTAVCVDENGMAKVFGGYPQYEDNAYFIRPNCEIGNSVPEMCTSSIPLTWKQNGQALKVYRTKGTPTGEQTFNLNNWQSGNGGTWEVWSVDNGTLNSTASTMINCALSAASVSRNNVSIYPNPVTDRLTIESTEKLEYAMVYDITGKLLFQQSFLGSLSNTLNIENCEPGVYIIKITDTKGVHAFRVIKQ